jgi:ribosomal protein S7
MAAVNAVYKESKILIYLKMVKLSFSSLLNYFSTSLLKNGKKKKTSFFFKNFQYFKRANKKKYFKHVFLLFFIAYRIRPLLEIKSVRKGSKYYLVPTPFNEKNRSIKSGIREISKSIKSRREYLLRFRIKKGLNTILKKQGPAWLSYKTKSYLIAKNIYHINYRWV